MTHSFLSCFSFTFIYLCIFIYPLIFLFHFFTHSSICFFINDLPVVIASRVRYSFSSVQLSLEIKKKWQIILSVHPTMNMMLLKTFSRGEVKVPSHLWQLKLQQTEQYWMNSISGQWKEICITLCGKKYSNFLFN